MSQWPTARCVLKRISPSGIPYSKLQGRKLFGYLQQMLSKDTEVCTFHHISYSHDVMLLQIILRRVPHGQENVDMLVAISVQCIGLGILSERSLLVLPLVEFWQAIHRGHLDNAICKRLTITNLGVKKYIQTLTSRLNLHYWCERGVYKLKLTCEKCNIKHCTLVSHTVN